MPNRVGSSKDTTFQLHPASPKQAGTSEEDWQKEIEAKDCFVYEGIKKYKGFISNPGKFGRFIS